MIYQVFTSSSVYLTLGMGWPLKFQIPRTISSATEYMNLLLVVHSNSKKLFASFPVHRIFEPRMISIELAAIHQNILSIVQLRNFLRKPGHVIEICNKRPQMHSKIYLGHIDGNKWTLSAKCLLCIH